MRHQFPVSLNRILIVIPVLILFTLCGPAARTQTEAVCIFRLTSDILDQEQPVYITGNQPELGYWHPDTIRMMNVGNHTWEYSMTLRVPASIEYKFTLGSWEKEGADGSGEALANFSLEITGDTVIHHRVAGWTGRQPKQKQASSILGKADHYPEMHHAGLIDRDVIVWLPEGYDVDTSNRYPVIYLHDGQNILDAATSAFGVEWRVDEAIDSLSKAGIIPPVIAVAIYNTPDRSAEYLPGDTASIYMDFIIHALKPFIDSAYRTLPGPESTITCGASAGGTIAFMLVWEHPDVFSRAICMSPALKIRHIDFVDKVLHTKEKREDIFLYMDVGGIGIESELKPGIVEMKKVLQQKGYVENRDFILMEDPAAAHNEAAWAKRFPHALLRCLQQTGEINEH